MNVAGLTEPGLVCSVTLARSWMGAVLIRLTWALSFPLMTEDGVASLVKQGVSSAQHRIVRITDSHHHGWKQFSGF